MKTYLVHFFSWLVFSMTLASYMVLLDAWLNLDGGQWPVFLAIVSGLAIVMSALAAFDIAVKSLPAERSKNLKLLWRLIACVNPAVALVYWPFWVVKWMRHSSL